MEAIESSLLGSMQELLAYARKRMADDDMAMDALQNSLLKAIRAAPTLQDEERVFPWFYRILDNTINDEYRRRQREQSVLSRYALESERAIFPEDREVICQCFIHLLPTLKLEYSEVIQMLDLDERDPAEVAAQIGITRGNLKVRHHRARLQLRTRLEESCRTCADHGCLDCSCTA